MGAVSTHRTPNAAFRLLAYLQFACVPWLSREMGEDGVLTVRFATHEVTRALSVKRVRLMDHLTWLTRQGYLLLRERHYGEASVEVRPAGQWNAGAAVRRRSGPRARDGRFVCRGEGVST